jgi:ribosomal protein L37E
MKPCADCGVQYNPWVMQFDHRDQSKKAFDMSLARKMGIKKLTIEAEKCDVICANCHFERTHKTRAWAYRRKKIFTELEKDSQLDLGL